MKRKRMIDVEMIPDQKAANQAEADKILAEIGRLYRERIRALYNRDQPSLLSIAEQIDALKSKLAKL